jgi:hypothetical protein
MIINPQILWGPIFHISLCLVCLFDDLCTAVHDTCFTIFLLNNIRHCLTKIQHIHITTITAFTKLEPALLWLKVTGRSNIWVPKSTSSYGYNMNATDIYQHIHPLNQFYRDTTNIYRVNVYWLVVWGIWIIFPYVGNVIIPTDELHHFSEV